MSEIEQEKRNADDPKPVAAKKKGMKKILLIAGIIVLLASAGGGFYFWRISATVSAESQKKTRDKKSDSKRDTGDADAEPATETSSNKNQSSKAPDVLQDSIPNDDDVKKIVELPPFIVNLADSDQARYLRMTVSLGVGGTESEGSKPDQLFITRVRNAMLAVLSDKKSADILTTEGKTKLRKELLNAAKKASEDPEVLSIYITDFIIQL